jgi:hypothetical protein
MDVMSNDSIEATMRLEVFAVGLLFLDGCAVQRHPNRFTLDPPWSVELPADYDNSVTPELRFASATFAHLGDKLVLKIV